MQPGATPCNRNHRFAKTKPPEHSGARERATKCSAQPCKAHGFAVGLSQKCPNRRRYARKCPVAQPNRENEPNGTFRNISAPRVWGAKSVATSSRSSTTLPRGRGDIGSSL